MCEISKDIKTRMIYTCIYAKAAQLKGKVGKVSMTFGRPRSKKWTSCDPKSANHNKTKEIEMIIGMLDVCWN